MYGHVGWDMALAVISISYPWRLNHTILERSVSNHHGNSNIAFACHGSTVCHVAYS